jgi:hypothetical protein
MLGAALDTYANQKTPEERLVVVAIAYYNLGVEYEHLRRFSNALKAYTKARKFALKWLGADHSVTQNLQETYQSALKKCKNLDRPSLRPQTSGLQSYFAKIGEKRH